ncbi:HlyD family secretion protein [Vibrio methylphosphonaticus]|uniref:HlyD family secretion protein n=1 Tax=Vibrio methylphosphonaticus TaxID=2946866 RepID=UPI00202AA2FD|nr:HlyD family secretion protein [Vibrio methylphosphonaticus]MCL9776589.1 HlyD family secretion protein [Vibrio methylphosphonaticus]
MFKKLITTFAVLAFAGYFTFDHYSTYIQNPWTRDGQVRADIIQITPRVTGPVVELNVKDNSFVNKGDLLFKIDPSTFLTTKDQAYANLLQVQALLDRAINEEKRSSALEKLKPGSVPVLTLNNLTNNVQTARANVKAAQASFEAAQLSLDFTTITAPSDGYITNLNLKEGSQVVANQPVVALIDNDSFWIEGFFEETDLRYIRKGSSAKVTLMSHPDSPLIGHVTSTGYGISKSDGSTGSFLLPNVNPNFQWIRLAQRIPVKVKLDNPPEDIQLIVGATASVLINKYPNHGQNDED